MSVKDDKMVWLDNDIEKIQTKTGMYISYYGEKGALHLVKEGIQNMVDECKNENSMGKNIDIEYQMKDDSIKIEDDGRGIPENEYPLEIFCTKLNSGSKMTREQGGTSAGENGVGMTAINALSSYFRLSTFRENKSHTIEFEAGVKTGDKVVNNPAKKHGTIMEFSPNQKYLGKKAKIPYKLMLEWIETLTYFIPEGINIKVTIFNGLEVVESHKFKHQSIKELLKKNIGKSTSDIIHLNGSTKVVEEYQGRKINRDMNLEMVFGYSNDIEPWVDSFCNTINTRDGGVHLDTATDVLKRYLQNATKKSLTDREKDKYDILYVDVAASLNVIVNLETTMQMHFAAQTKEKVTNEDMAAPIREICTKMINEYFDSNKSTLETYCKIVKLNAKARIEMNKVRTASIKEVTNNFSEHKMKNFEPATNRGKQYKVIYIIEGDSAKGSAVEGRDPATQAFFALRGLTANPYKKSLHDLMSTNDELRNLVTILGCNIGKDFDITKLKYDEIRILTDADIDGHGITSGVCAFFILHMPELVKAKKIVKCISPLYHVDNKKRPYVTSKAEFVELYQDKITSSYEVEILNNGKFEKLKKAEMAEFIKDTVDYRDELIRVAGHFGKGINKFFIERVASYLSMNAGNSAILDLFNNNKFVVNFMAAIQEEYPEIVLRGQSSLRGVVQGKFQSINITPRTVLKMSALFSVYRKYGCTIRISEKGNEARVSTIGKFLDETQKYVPKILERYKGLSEVDPLELGTTTLNPDNETLIVLTFGDIDADLEVFKVLHSDEKKYAKLRKEMMQGYKINRDDLDN